MNHNLTIALDAMGGDKAPGAVVAGAAMALDRRPKLKFRFYGDKEQIEPLLQKRKALVAVSEIIHTTNSIANDEKPSVALRTGKKSSMRLAIDAVRAGDADCMISSGNTGALMAMAMIVLRKLPGVARPAIATYFPHRNGECVMLDLGANIDCAPKHLVQFAVMGCLFARTVLGIENPRVGLLNVGVEEAKGNNDIKTAAAMLRAADLPGIYHGFVEGDDIAAGTVDVIVTDGFTGNVALKVLEGTAKLLFSFIRQTFRASTMAKIGYLFARGALRKLKMRSDPRRYNGAMLIGLQGICVKSHGSADGFGFASAIEVAADLAGNGFNNDIRAGMERLAESSKDIAPIKAASA